MIRRIISAYSTIHYVIFLCCAIGMAAVITSCTSYQRAYPPLEQQPFVRQKAVQKPYVVDGKRYEPLSSHEGFEQEGMASSYGQEFHGRRTSSGEMFDMNAMTAAHKTLPLGVYVRVQHKRSGSEVIVRINDRGPFVKDRIIDLSEAAAARIGMLREGLVPVKVTALGYKAEGKGITPVYHSPLNYDSGSFALQVAAFSIQANARRYMEELKRVNEAAEVQESVVGGIKYYRVRVGHYTSLRVAQAAQEQYERKGFRDCFVVSVD